MLNWIRKCLEWMIRATYRLEDKIEHVRWVLAGRPCRKGITMAEACEAARKELVDTLRQQYEKPTAALLRIPSSATRGIEAQQEGAERENQ